MVKLNHRATKSAFSFSLGAVVKSALGPGLGLALLTFSTGAAAQIRMVSPNGLAYTEVRAVAQFGGFTAMSGTADGIDNNGDGVGDDYRGGLYLYEWGNLRLNYVPRGPEFAHAFLGNEVRLSNTWLAASAPYYNVTAGTGSAGAVVLSKKVNGSFGPVSYLVTDSRIPTNASMPIAVSDSYLVIGLPTGLIGGGNAGAALVFSYDAGLNRWGSPAVVSPSDGHAGDAFGSTVSIDGNRIAIGAPNHDDNLSDAIAPAGRAYVFDRSGSLWQQKLAYTATDATPGGRYGDKLDVAGERLIVSAPFAAGVGFIQILERDASGWRPRYIDYRSALSVAIYNDKAIIGLSLFPNSTGSSNRVRTYRLNGSTWSPYGGMVGKDVDDSFGESVDIHSDQVAVSARGVDYNGRQSVGASYLENFWATSAGL